MPRIVEHPIGTKVYLKNKQGQLTYMEGAAYIVDKDYDFYYLKTQSGDILTVVKRLTRNRNWRIRLPENPQRINFGNNY